MTITETKDRTTWLSKILGPILAKSIREDIHRTTALLDDAGVERKGITTKAEGEFSEEGKPADTPESPPDAMATDPVEEAAKKLAQQIYDAVGGNLASLTIDVLVDVIRGILQPSDESTGENSDTGEVDPNGGTQTMHDNNKAASENADKALALINKMISDQGELVQEFKAAQEEIGKTKELAPLVEKLVSEMEAVKEQLSLRPRSASQDDSTVLDPTNADVKSLAELVQKGIDGNKEDYLGIPGSQLKGQPT